MTMRQEQGYYNNYKTDEQQPFIGFVLNQQQKSDDVPHMAGRIDPELILRLYRTRRTSEDFRKG
jgi:hypothetical protein